MSEPIGASSTDPDSNRAGRPNGWGVLAGLVIATCVPILSLMVALVWDVGIVELEPNGPFVQGVQGISPLGLLLAPIGIVVALWAGRVRSLLTWVASFIVAIPLLAVLWFIAVAYLGGLAGEPF